MLKIILALVGFRFGKNRNNVVLLHVFWRTCSEEDVGEILGGQKIKKSTNRLEPGDIYSNSTGGTNYAGHVSSAMNNVE